MENSIIIENQSQEDSPEITFYLTQSSPFDSEGIKGEKFGAISNLTPEEVGTLVSSVPITADSNVVFEYKDKSGDDVVGFVNHYIPQDSKKYKIDLYLKDVDQEGILLIESYP